jgi:hypothetical protein
MGFFKICLSVFFAVCLGFFFHYYQQGPMSRALWWLFAAYVFAGLAAVFYLQHRILPKQAPLTGVAPAFQAPASTITPGPSPPRTLYDYFKTDFPDAWKFPKDFVLIVNDDPQYEFESKVVLNFDSKTKFLALYFPASSYTRLAYEALPELYEDLLNPTYSGVINIEAIRRGERGTEFKDLQFSGRIFLYHEEPLLSSEIETLTTLYKSKGLDVQFRGFAYAEGRNHPLVSPSK